MHFPTALMATRLVMKVLLLWQVPSSSAETLNNLSEYQVMQLQKETSGRVLDVLILCSGHLV